jgi:soluble lytic murein transglycosylase-like protein
MVALLFNPLPALRNISLRYCFILLLVVPVFAAPPPPASATVVVKADAKSGRLVRTVVIEAQPVSHPELERMVDSIAGEQGVESPLVHSVIRAESNYNPNAVSPKGALGLMQLIPSTARRFGVTNPFDVRENIEGGVRYLRFLLNYYQGDYPKAIAAYNAGEAAVDKYHGIPPYSETQNYVHRVAKNLETARQKTVVPAPAAALPANSETANSETLPRIETSVGSDGRLYYRTP